MKPGKKAELFFWRPTAEMVRDKASSKVRAPQGDSTLLTRLAACRRCGCREAVLADVHVPVQIDTWIQSVRQDGPTRSDLDKARRACALHETLRKFEGPVERRRDLSQAVHEADGDSGLGDDTASQDLRHAAPWGMDELPFVGDALRPERSRAPGGTDGLSENVNNFFNQLGNADWLTGQFGALCAPESNANRRTSCTPERGGGRGDGGGDRERDRDRQGRKRAPATPSRPGRREERVRGETSSDNSARDTEQRSGRDGRGGFHPSSAEEELLLAMPKMRLQPESIDEQLEEMLPDWMRP